MIASQPPVKPSLTTLRVTTQLLAIGIPTYASKLRRPNAPRIKVIDRATCVHVGTLTPVRDWKPYPSLPFGVFCRSIGRHVRQSQRFLLTYQGNPIVVYQPEVQK